MFAKFVEDCLQPLGPVYARGMFGGHGIYLDGVMFALIADDVLYLKVDDQNRAAFEEAGLEPFVYEGKHRPMTMSYNRAPDCLEEWNALEPWVTGALAAATRAAAKKKPRPPRGSGRWGS